MKTFGMKIREERKKRSMTQLDLAEYVGVSMRMIGEYETGNRRPHRSKMKEIAEKLELPYEYLVDDRYETVLSTFNGVKNDTPADEKYVTASEEDDTNPVEAPVAQKGASPSVRTQRAIQEANFIQTKANALFAGADLPQDAKDKFFEALYESYMACRAQAVEDGIDVDRIENEQNIK